MTALPHGAPIAVSWSGGKDSCLALHRAVRAGAEPRRLLCMLDAAGARSRSHGLRPEVVRAQADRLGLELHVGRAGWPDYRKELMTLLRDTATAGIADVVFGDIDLQDHRDWEEAVCAEAGLRAHLPLWQQPRRALLEELWSAGFVARLVAADASALEPDLLGAVLDRDLAEQLEHRGIDACGENGEFHTVVVDGPLLRQPLPLVFDAPVLRSGYWVADARLSG